MKMIGAPLRDVLLSDRLNKRGLACSSHTEAVGLVCTCVVRPELRLTMDVMPEEHSPLFLGLFNLLAHGPL